ncbi:MAG: protein phosphatase 2C domain-containing protein [Gemmataceae bacterium]
MVAPSAPVRCPACRTLLHVAAEHLGRPVRCPACRQAFRTALPGSPPAPARRIEVASATTAGRLRERNEDAVLTQQLAWDDRTGHHELTLLVVADGMGGHAAGDRASQVAIAAVARSLAPRLAEWIGADPVPEIATLVDLLDTALWDASRSVYHAASEPGCGGMGATAVAALIIDGQAAIAHVGDCRAYHHTRDGLRRITTDQTLARRLVELGTLTEREAERHPSAGQVAQALGRLPDVEPSRHTLTLTAGDWLLLASDGLHTHLSDAEIAAHLAAARTPADLAATLLACANHAGGRDNGTVVTGRAGA